MLISLPPVSLPAETLCRRGFKGEFFPFFLLSVFANFKILTYSFMLWVVSLDALPIMLMSKTGYANSKKNVVLANLEKQLKPMKVDKKDNLHR